MAVMDGHLRREFWLFLRVMSQKEFSWLQIFRFMFISKKTRENEKYVNIFLYDNICDNVVTINIFFFARPQTQLRSWSPFLHVSCPSTSLFVRALSHKQFSWLQIFRFRFISKKKRRNGIPDYICLIFAKLRFFFLEPQNIRLSERTRAGTLFGFGISTNFLSVNKRIICLTICLRLPLFYRFLRLLDLFLHILHSNRFLFNSAFWLMRHLEWKMQKYSTGHTVDSFVVKLLTKAVLY